MTKKTEQHLTIPPPQFQTAEFLIEGHPTSPYVQLRFSEKARLQIKTKQQAGSTAKKGSAREARDFENDYIHSMYESVDGWRGIPASAFRCALISACRLVGFKMTIAKMSIFIEADGIDKRTGKPLVRIDGKPEYYEEMVRNATGVVDIRVRAMWRKWSAKLRIQWAADQFTLIDVTNLLHRAGMQVGIGEGRHDSPNSTGMGYGMFGFAKKEKT